MLPVFTGIIMRKIHLLLFLFFISFNSCKKETITKQPKRVEVTTKQKHIEYASGFSIENHSNYTILKVTNPWPNSKKALTYIVVKEDELAPQNLKYDVLIQLPITKLIVTSTTHIPALESLNVLDKLIGFPNTNFISSPKARQLIEKGKIHEIGKTQHINTEIVMDLQPDAIIAFGVDGSNKSFATLKKTGTPILYNGDWLEKTALGKAEWIRFFGVLLGKEKEAQTIFNTIKNNYNQAKQIVAHVKQKPTVLAGMMYKDTWYVPYGNSFAAQFIADAGGEYLWKNTLGSGSIALNFEEVLDTAQQADFWVSTSGIETKNQVLSTNNHFDKFDALTHNHTYFANRKGKTGGLLFFELAPTRPDLVLKDLIKIFHPNLLPNHELYFYHQIK